MLKIGDFSRLAHVTVKALRHYAQLGLLKPVWIDRFTGYRYYNLEQLPRLNRILALKELGFSLEQIKPLLDETLSADQLRRLFDHKQSELAQRLQDEQARLQRVAERLRQIEAEGRLPADEVTVKPIAALPVASMRAMIPALSDLGDQAQLMHVMIEQWLEQNDLRPAGPWLTVYHRPDYTDRHLDVEVAVVLPEAGRTRRLDNKAIGLRQLPAVDTMASVLRPEVGPAPQQAYLALYTWAERNGYTLTGPARELLLNDPTPQGPQTCFTELQIPVESNLKWQQHYILNPYRKETEMEPKFVTLPALTIVGVRYFGKNENQEISTLWSVANTRMEEIKHADLEAAYGICLPVDGAAPGEFEYIAGRKVNQVEAVPEGLVVRNVAASKYAVFTHVGALDKLRDTYHYIYHTWLPKSGHELNGNLDFEVYDADFKDFEPDSRFYIYVAIK